MSIARASTAFTTAHLIALACCALALAACGEQTPGADAGRSDDGGALDAGAADGADATPDGSTGDAGDGRDAAGGADADAGVGPAVPRSMIFLHTNDEHSHELGFGPEVDDYPTPAAPTDTNIVGGVKRRAKVVQQLREEAQLGATPVALVSAGDMMMGSLFHIGNAIGGSVPAIDYAFATALQYDVITLGNHELDFGVGMIAGALSTGGVTLSGQAGVLRIPVVSSNLRFSMSSPADDALAALYAPQGAAGKPLRRLHVQTFGTGSKAVKVGFLGLMGVDAALVAPFKSPLKFSLPTGSVACAGDQDCPGSVCLPPASDPTAARGLCATAGEGDAAAAMAQLVADAAEAVAELRGRGVDLVVAVAHVGVDDRELGTLEAMGLGPENAELSEEIVLVKGVDAALAPADVPGIDLVIGGHSHTRLDRPLAIPNARSGITTHVVQAGSYGRYVGKLRLHQAGAGEPWTLDDGYTGLVPVDATTSPTGLPTVTNLILDALIDGIVGGLESTVVSNPNDGLVYPGEQCDGAELPNGGQCVPLVPAAVGGRLACHPNRQLDLSGCVMAATGCGDGVTGADERCDALDLGGASCQTLGYDGGTLGCAANCTFDLSGCAPFFPSLAEAALNFQRPGAPVRDDPGVAGDLFFHAVGTTAFDVPEPEAFHESNLINLVADAERYALNTVSPSGLADPVRVTINANGVIRDAIQRGRTGALTLEDLFRVLPLGVSPVEGTPGYPIVDYYVTARELRRGLEIGVNQGLVSSSFWLGVSGARVEYDPSRPAFDRSREDTTGRITRIQLSSLEAGAPWDDRALEAEALFDADAGAGDAAYPGGAERLIHVGTSLYITLFAEALGECPRAADGAQRPECKRCSTGADCPLTGTRCDAAEGRCRGADPVAFSVRSFAPINEYGYYQELKEFLGLLHYVRSGTEGVLPESYNQPVPRRLCCVGNACGADRICAPQGI